jgi:hypothetical protein
MRGVFFALALLISSISIISMADAEPMAAANASDGPSRLDGRWELDWKQSESFEPIMKALEGSWLMRRLAGIARVRLGLRAEPADCEECPEKVLVKLSTPISSNEVWAVLDGVPRPGRDPRGRTTLDSYIWTAERGLEMFREVELPSGRFARLHETRDLADSSDTISSVLVVSIDGVEQASVRRIFRRVDD